MRINHLRTIIQINFMFSLTILLLVCASDHNTLNVDNIPKESSGTVNCYHPKKYLLI